MHDSTFDYLKPSDEQLALMGKCREGAKEYAALLQEVLPDGPDKTFAIRSLRTVAVWANIAITRHPDGAPRE